MVKAKIKGVFPTYKTLADGTRRKYWYHRASGRRLRGEPGSATFLADYAEAEKPFDYSRGTLAGLIRDYSLSRSFERRAASTKIEYKRMLGRIEHQFGSMPIGALEDPRVRKDFMAWRDTIAGKSGLREADNRLSILSAVLTWGVKNGHIFSNNVAGFDRLYRSDRSEKIWLPEHIEAFNRVAPIELQTALFLALHTGQRQGDLLRLVWNNYDGGAMSLRQGKTGRRVRVPCTDALKSILDGIARVGAVILTTKTGRPWKPRYFKAQWEIASRAAGIDDLHFHDLRGTAITMLAEAGCSVPEIAAITGHSIKTASAIIDKYLDRTGHLAGNAIMKLENARRTKIANQLQTSIVGKLKEDSK